MGAGRRTGRVPDGQTEGRPTSESDRGGRPRIGIDGRDGIHRPGNGGTGGGRSEDGPNEVHRKQPAHFELRDERSRHTVDTAPDRYRTTNRRGRYRIRTSRDGCDDG